VTAVTLRSRRGSKGAVSRPTECSSKLATLRLLRHHSLSRGQAAVEYVLMLAFVVGIGLVIGASMKQFLPGVVGGIVRSIAQGIATQKTIAGRRGEEASKEDEERSWWAGVIFGDNDGATIALVSEPTSQRALTQLVEVSGAWRVLPTEPGMARRGHGGIFE